MSLALPVLFHWSPVTNREGIIRRGLRPTTPTAVERWAERGVGPTKIRPSLGHEEAKAVCLGTSPSHAWSLCGAVWANPGETWDLWQVALDDDDEVVPMPFEGWRLAEIRVLNRIPKSRVWHVGSRTVARQRWSCAS